MDLPSALACVPPAFLSVLAQLPVFVVVIDRKGVLRWVNRTSYDINESDVLGQPADVLIYEDDRPKWWEAFRLTIHGRETVRVEFRIATPAAPGVARITGVMSPVVVEGGAVEYAACVSRDAAAGGLFASVTLETPQTPIPPTRPIRQQLVTLNQIAAIVHRRKISMRRYASAMPTPSVPGRRGQAWLRAWPEVRGWLESTFHQLMPDRFPSAEE